MASFELSGYATREMVNGNLPDDELYSKNYSNEFLTSIITRRG
jgi:hypothetical protein